MLFYKGKGESKVATTIKWELIKEIDLDGNGRISFNEFKYMITHIIN